MTRRLTRRAWAYVSLTAAAPLSVFLAAMVVVAHSGFGRDNLSIFGFWSVASLLPLFFGFGASESTLSRRAPTSRALVGFAIGALSGTTFTFALALGMGPMIGGFAFPVLYIWAGSSALACSMAALLASPPTANATTKHVVQLFVAAVLSLAFVVSLPVLLVLGSMHVWGRAQREVYTLPSAFEGPVFVLYDQATAPPIPIVNGRRELGIPASGVLLTSSKVAEGWKDPEVYYVRGNGARVRVHTDWGHADTIASEVRTYWLPTRGSVTLNGVRQPNLTYEAFIVGPSNRETRLEERADSLLDSLWQLYAR
jgi:hypothetical protein